MRLHRDGNTVVRTSESSGLSTQQRRLYTTGKNYNVNRKRKRQRNSKDEDFRKKTIHQVKRVNVDANTHRARNLKSLLSDLHAMRQPNTSHVRERADGLAPEAYEMTTMAARSFLLKADCITAPIFLTEAAPASLFDLETIVRPIEQVLNYFADPDEEYSFEDTEALENHDLPFKHVTVAAMKKRFANRQFQPFSMNFPELPLPITALELPIFVRGRDI